VGGGGGERTKERAEGGRRRGPTKALQVRSEEFWGKEVWRVGGGAGGWRSVGLKEVCGGERTRERERAEGGRRRGQTKALQLMSELRGVRFKK
jgi:hypothetical protein